MSMNDPIADLLTRIRNAVHANHGRVDINSSNIKLAILEILKNEGFIRGFKIFENGNKKTLRIYLKYTDENESVILGLKRISKPGRRVYQKADDIRPIFNNIGVSILTTSKGVMTGKNAMNQHIGGEVLAHIW